MTNNNSKTVSSVLEEDFFRMTRNDLNNAFLQVRPLYGDTPVVISYARIIWIEASGMHSHFHMLDGSSVATGKHLGEVQRFLTEHDVTTFIRTGRSEIVNLRWVKSLEGNRLRLMHCAGFFVVGPAYREHFHTCFNHLVGSLDAYVNVFPP